ncbi:N-acyl-D-amino-acid deacylase family protein [Streptomyces sp. NPDC002540]
MESYLRELTERAPAVDVGCLVGHSTLRLGAMDDLTRPAAPREAAEMRERMREAMTAGAIGLSSGVWYPPAAAATLDEIVDLAGVAAEFGGVAVSHVRDEGDDVIAALDEAFEVGARAGVPLVISPHKVVGQSNFGRTAETIALIDQMCSTQAISFDVYPYTAASSWLTPDYLHLCKNVTVTWSKPYPRTRGRDVADLAGEWGCAEEEAARRLQPGGAVYLNMDERDVRRVLSHPRAMIGSDGIPGDTHPHPRLWGTFPRVLGRYCRELGLFSLEEAVRRMTALPAVTYGFAGRGTIRPGAYADLVLFDPDEIVDTATYQEPTRAAIGIDLVLVNGTPVWRSGGTCKARPGRVLERSAEAAVTHRGETA